jgi:hypothetical protein
MAQRLGWLQTNFNSIAAKKASFPIYRKLGFCEGSLDAARPQDCQQFLSAGWCVDRCGRRNRLSFRAEPGTAGQLAHNAADQTQPVKPKLEDSLRTQLAQSNEYQLSAV